MKLILFFMKNVADGKPVRINCAQLCLGLGTTSLEMLNIHFTYALTVGSIIRPLTIVDVAVV